MRCFNNKNIDMYSRTPIDRTDKRVNEQPTDRLAIAIYHTKCEQKFYFGSRSKPILCTMLQMQHKLHSTDIKHYNGECTALYLYCTPSISSCMLYIYMYCIYILTKFRWLNAETNEMRTHIDSTTLNGVFVFVSTPYLISILVMLSVND